MKISAVIIAKNEESTIPKLLESLYCRVDEIVIVDTGSQDKTKEIAKAAADVYGEYEWNDDFASARNYAKSLATNEWILSIDCDEVLSGSVFLDESKDALTVRLVWADGEGETEAVRIFRKSIDWVGKIHEHPDVEAGRIGNSNATITFGKSPSHDIDPARNLRILGKAYAEGDRTPRTLYYLARELVSIGNYEWCLDALAQYRQVSDYPAELADSYLIDALCHDRMGDKPTATVSALLAIGTNPDLSVAYDILSHLTGNERWLDFKKVADDRWVLQKHDFDFLWNKVWKPHS